MSVFSFIQTISLLMKNINKGGVALILSCCIASYSCKAQQQVLLKVEKDKSFTAQGYLINIYGEYDVWIFQPCIDSNVSVLEVNSNQSFFVQDMVNDLGYTFLRDARGIGKKIPLLIYDHFSKQNVKDTIEYLYCQLTINPIDSFYKVSDCAYTVKYRNIKKELGCWSLENYVTNLVPLDPKIREKYSKIKY